MAGEAILDEIEVRVLGCLIEKGLSNPEYYPLSLNALVNACNQKSNREPVVAYDEDTVMRALEAMKEKQLVYFHGGTRVTKYGQNFLKSKNLINQEAAVLGELMLRGPQTVGELRVRTERMCKFGSLAEVEETLATLQEMDMVMRLPRQPGRKEPRYVHLLSGRPEPEEEVAARPRPDNIGTRQGKEELEKLEEEIKTLRRELEELKQQFQDFKAQFE